MKKSSTFIFTILFMCSLAPLMAQHSIDMDTESIGNKKIIKIYKDDAPFEHDPLNLTDSQKKEFKKLDLALAKETLSMRNELGVKELELEVELDKENIDIKKINALIDEAHKLKASLEKKLMATEIKKRNLLTDEQKKKWTFHPPVEKEIIMLRGDAPHNMMRFHDNGMRMPMEEMLEEEIEIHEK
jgi:Spy/CpxP family protein refolding chaperone